MQIKGFIGLCYYKSEIKSPAMKAQDKMNKKGMQWKVDRDRS